MKQDLLCFLPGSPERLRILTVESTHYLPELSARYPNARLTAVTSYEEVPELVEFRGLAVDWYVSDYRRDPLPLPGGAFDIIIAEPCLEYVYDSYDTLMDLSRHLTDVGTLYTQFTNIRYGGILAVLQAGDFPVRDEHLYAKAEVVKMLNDAIFKEVHFAPGEQDEDSENEVWAELGFDNFSRDLATKNWLVKACRSTASVANLKGLYTKETREELARLLHRIEYDVDRAESLATLKNLCEREMIFPEYLADFIAETCIHREIVRSLVL